MLDNRELAIVIWTAVFLLCVSLMSSVRPHLKSVFRSAANWTIVIPFSLYGLMMAAVVSLAEQLGFWSTDMLGSTILWVVLTGGALIFKLNDVLAGISVFGSELVGLVNVVAVLSFFMSASVFSLAWELVIVLVVTIVSVLRVVADHMDDAKAVVHMVDLILAAFSVWLLWFSISDIVSQGSKYDWRSLVIDFVLPLIFTAVTLLFLFVLSWYAAYELLESRLKAMSGKESISRAAMLGVAMVIGPRPALVNGVQVAGRFELQNATSMRDGMHAARTHLLERREKLNKENRRIVALSDNTGLVGVDSEGRQLDRREFRETKGALNWLATCQMGWYRNRGGSYDLDLLDRVESLFSNHHLPAEHGVVMKVSADGQSWYGYRRTVTGWVFAIGSNSGPPNQWFYDCAEIPASFPGAGVGWGEWESRSPNWRDD